MAIFVDVTHATDLENGLSNNEKEHVLLSTSEMMCIGYETKLVQTPGIHPLVRNLKTSLVLSRAEFDLVSAACAVEVTKHLERATEFMCERVRQSGLELQSHRSRRRFCHPTLAGRGYQCEDCGQEDRQRQLRC